MYYKARVSFRDYESPSKVNDIDYIPAGFSETFTAETMEDLYNELSDWINCDLKNSGQPMYRDTEDGREQVGKIYSFWYEIHDRQHGIYNVWRQAWVEITEVEETAKAIA